MVAMEGGRKRWSNGGKVSVGEKASDLVTLPQLSFHEVAQLSHRRSNLFPRLILLQPSLQPDSFSAH